MDLQRLEQIIKEEVQKVVAESRRDSHLLYPADQNETLDPNACNSPACTIPAHVNTSANPAPKQKPAPTPLLKPQGPAVLCLISGARENWDLLTKAFHSWKSQGIHLDAVLSAGGRDVFSNDELKSLGLQVVDNPKHVYELMYDLKRYSAVFLPSISRTHAAKLALGITDTVSLNLTLASLAQKVPTFASDEGLAPTACIVCGNNVPGIQDVLNNYRQHLSKMGMRLMSAPDAAKQINRIVLNIAESGGSELITTLVTEEEAEKLNGPVVKVSRGGLITPLAMDLLSRKGIQVVIVPPK